MTAIQKVAYVATLPLTIAYTCYDFVDESVPCAPLAFVIKALTTLIVLAIVADAALCVAKYVFGIHVIAKVVI